ncbi:MAG TPA: HAD family phosphatase [Woeseiaceae bacterium]|nr:HAD family phosphatase [Woeseiaceae bacterium]
MSTGRPPAAVFFDMDGTLVDSEPLTEAVVLNLIAAEGLPPPRFPLSQFHGVTWERIASILVDHYPGLAGASLAGQLQHEFHRRLLAENPPLINGVQQAFRTASELCTTGVVSSSTRATIAAVVERARLAGSCRLIVGAEDVTRSKPDPECYLLAAERAGADARQCLVFEDSAAGLQAARTAGMFAVGVVGNRDTQGAAPLMYAADIVIKDYDVLAADFFSSFAARP